MPWRPKAWAQVLKLVALGPFFVPGHVHHAANQADSFRVKAGSAVSVDYPRTAVSGSTWSLKGDQPDPCTTLLEAPAQWHGPEQEATQGAKVQEAKERAKARARGNPTSAPVLVKGGRTSALQSGIAKLKEMVASMAKNQGTLSNSASEQGEKPTDSSTNKTLPAPVGKQPPAK